MQCGWKLGGRWRKDLSFIIRLVTHWMYGVFPVSCSANVPQWLPSALCTEITRHSYCRTCYCLLPQPQSPGTRTPGSLRVWPLLPLQVLLLWPRTLSSLLLYHFILPLSARACFSRQATPLPRASSASCANLSSFPSGHLIHSAAIYIL